jgi:predicted ATPase/DNA-binding CsgD family transcriptional regulator
VSTGAVEVVTPREAEILAALGSHLTNGQIASRLHLSVRTVEAHVASLLRKLGVTDRRALAELAPTVGAGPALGAGVVGVPTPWTSLVGRRAEVAEVVAALAGARLVTLVGPGGVGKTRLAVEVAHAVGPSFPFGGGFVELVPVQPDFVVQAVATALGVSVQPGRSVEQAVQGHVARRRIFIVLDNCEHVLPAVAAFVANLLAACPQVTVLSTSRERLGVAGERVIAVNPLSIAGAQGSDAARLFVDRARAADPSFTDDSDVVGELCARLDGLPLAIELAAARVGSVGARALLDATTDRLRLLAGGHGMLERHRSLRAVLDWSYDLLSGPDQQLLRRLGVFANAFDIDAVVSVAGGGADPAEVIDTLGHLVDKSLVVRRPATNGPARWQLLETVRSYALDRLVATAEAAETQARHRSWAASVAEALVRRLESDGSWAEEFDQVADDLRAALGHAPARLDATSFELARATGHLAFARGLIAEAERHLRGAVAYAPTSEDASHVLQTAAHVATNDMRIGAAFRLLVEAAGAVGGADDAFQSTCLAQAVECAVRFAGGLDEAVPVERLSGLVADARGLAPPTDRAASGWVALAESLMATGESDGTDLVTAEAALADARSADEPALISAAMDAVGGALMKQGRHRDSYRIYRERMDVVARLHLYDPQGAYEIDDAINMVAESGSAAGELREALALQRAAFVAYDVQTRPAHAAAKLVVNLALTGWFDEAAATAERMWSAWVAAGSPFAGWMAPPLLAAALAHGLRGDEAAHREWVRRTAMLDPGDDPLRRRHAGAFAAFVVARVALHAGDVEQSRSVTAQYLDSPPVTPAGALSCYDAYPRAFAADVAAAIGSADAHTLIESASHVATENRWATACLERARGRLLGDHDALQRSADAFADIDARFETACTLLLVPPRADEAERLLFDLGCAPPA